MNKPILYVDMDNVIVDFFSHPRYFVPKDSYNDEAIYKKGFFRELKPLPYSLQVVKALHEREDLDVYILTHGLAGSSYCYQEKVDWIKEHLPEMTDRLIITCDKALNKGDFLIDDDIKWNDFEGKFIEFTPYNLLKYRLDVDFHPDTYKEMWGEVITQINKELKNGN